MTLKKTLDKELTREQLKAISDLEQKPDRILEISLDQSHRESVSMQKRLFKYRQSILIFVNHNKVKPDNTASERAIRNIKVKQKISGQFKSEKGSNDFCVIRSVLDTLIKRTQNILENLTLIAKSQPAE
jgi:hypothetical protein